MLDQWPRWYTRPPPGLTFVLSGPSQSLARSNRQSASERWYWKNRTWLLVQSLIQEAMLRRTTRAKKLVELWSKGASDTERDSQRLGRWKAVPITGAVAAGHGVSWLVLLDNLSAQSCCHEARSFVFWLFPNCISVVSLSPPQLESMASTSALCLQKLSWDNELEVRLSQGHLSLHSSRLVLQF